MIIRNELVIEQYLTQFVQKHLCKINNVLADWLFSLTRFLSSISWHEGSICVFLPINYATLRCDIFGDFSVLRHLVEV